MTKLSFEQKIIYLILLLGIALSLIQFIYNRSLWVDEAMLSLNIINKGSIELLKPLDDGQVAPLLFLQIEKLFSVILPDSEYGLRLLPLLCFWFSMYFFYKILKLTFTNLYTIIFALSLFAFNFNLVIYSSEVKQYMCDVLVLTAVFYFILRQYNKEEYKYYLLGILGAVSIFLSNVAPIILFGGGIFLFYDFIVNKKLIFKNIAGVIFAWVITFLLFYYFFIHGNPAKDNMVDYWTRQNAFMPLNPLSIGFFQFLFEKFKMIFGSLFVYMVFGKFLALLFLIGLTTLIIKRKSGVLLMVLIPIFLHLLLSAIKMYPFDLRLILYTLPLLIITISFGFEYLADMLFTDLKIDRFRLLAIIIPLSLFYLFINNGFPRKNEEIKKSITYIQNNVNKSDKVYVHWGAARAFKYYHDIQYFNIPAPVINGNEDKNCNVNCVISEMRNLKGRNWLLFSHISVDEEAYLIRQLDSLGFNKVEAFTTYGSSTYLYDFKE